MKELLLILFQGVLVLFTIASTLLAAYSTQNRLRLRKIRISWRSGKLNGFPLFATVFLSLIIPLSLVVVWLGRADHYYIFSAYLWIGCMWFIASYFASKHYITDYGIVKNINETSQTIPWFQIIDLVEREEKKGIEYTFSYSEPHAPLTNGFKQIKFFVPSHRLQAFKKVVSLKLNARFDGKDLPNIDLNKIQRDQD